MARNLVEHLEQICAPCVESEIGRYQMRGAVGIARTVERQIQHQANLEADTLHDMQSLLGDHIADVDQGLAALQSVVCNEPAARARDLIWLFARMERRLEFLWAPLMIAQHSLPLERISPPGPIHRPAGGAR
jgi:hypothetical protein